MSNTYYHSCIERAEYCEREAANQVIRTSSYYFWLGRAEYWRAESEAHKPAEPQLSGRARRQAGKEE